MSLYVSLPVVNEKYVESIRQKVYENACECFHPRSDYFDGACFEEDGPSLKELLEIVDDDHSKEKYAKSVDLNHWNMWLSIDVMDDFEDFAKRCFKEENVWNCQITESNKDAHNDAINTMTSEIEWALGEGLYEYLRKRVHVPTKDEKYVEQLEEDYQYTFNNINEDEDWRDRYFNDERWKLNDVDMITCHACDDDTPHFEHIIYSKLLIQVGCTADVCAVCGDGSV